MSAQSKMKAADIRAALKDRYPHPEYGLVFEVAQATGFNANRHIDAIAMDTWPSRGLALHGIEIKVSVSDFRREIKDPAKAEELARFCDYFWIAAPAGVIPVKEMPLAWGLIEVCEDGSTKTRVHAQSTDAQAVDRAFLAAVFRAASRKVDPDTLEAVTERLKAEIHQGFEKEVERRVTAKAGHGSRAERSWNKLCSDLDIDPDSNWSLDRDVVPSIKAVMRSGAFKEWGGMRSLKASLTEAIDHIDVALSEIGEPAPKVSRRKA